MFDHTSIIKTILSRFAAPELLREKGAEAVLHWLEAGHPHYMGRRVHDAANLGELLGESAPRPAPDRSALLQWLTGRRAERANRLATAPVAYPAEQRIFSDLERMMIAAERELRNQGLPPEHP